MAYSGLHYKRYRHSVIGLRHNVTHIIVAQRKHWKTGDQLLIMSSSSLFPSASERSASIFHSLH